MCAQPREEEDRHATGFDTYHGGVCTVLLFYIAMQGPGDSLFCSIVAERWEGSVDYTSEGV
jgi:hypothetical protein